jgi:putative ABC transport system permease protein
MNIFTIPVKNLKVKFFKTFLLVFVFSIGITSVIGLNKISKTVSHALEDKMNRFGANILVYPKIDEVNISYGGIQLGNISYEVKYLSESRIRENILSIKNRENISAVAPKLVKTYEIDNKVMGIVGIDIDEEKKIKSYWHIDGKMFENERSVILGEGAATILNKKIGDFIEIFREKHTISGIISKTGSEEDNMIFMDLHNLQRLTQSEDKVNFVEVSALCAGCPIDEIVAQIRGKNPHAEINAIQKIVKQRMSAINFVERLAYILSLVIILTACFMIAIFMYASVNERKKEIGILRALGYSKFNIFSIFTIESILIGAFSGLAGYIGGYFLSIELLKVLDITENVHISFSIIELSLSVLIVVLLSGLSSTFPSLKASKISPSEALISL